MDIETGGEQKNINWLRFSSKFAVDMAVPGYIPLNQPIEGISTELRYHTRLWRVRLGGLAHGVWLIQAVMNQDYLLAAANTGVIIGGAVLVGNIREWKWRRLKRMYLPFLDKF